MAGVSRNLAAKCRHQHSRSRPPTARWRCTRRSRTTPVNVGRHRDPGGVRRQPITSRTSPRRFADAGYHAVAPHFFHRAGGGTAPVRRLCQGHAAVRRPHRRGDPRDVDATLRGSPRAGLLETRSRIVGFCFGGRVTFLVAAPARRRRRRVLRRRDRHRAVPAVPDAHRGSATSADTLARTVRRPRRSHSRRRSRATACRSDDAAVATEIVRYPEGGHGFYRDVSDDYEPGAAKDAWERTIAWFNTHAAPQ